MPAAVLSDSVAGWLSVTFRSHFVLLVDVSAGPIAVKAAIWAVVEQMHARGISKLYAGPISSFTEVGVGLKTKVMIAAHD